MTRHIKTSIAIALCITVGLALALPSAVHAAKLFRYMDERGNLVISYTIPNDRVKYGYEVVDETGRLLERVERQLTDEEYANKLHREKIQKECSIALRRVQTMYQGQADIDAAEEQALISIDTRIANAKANLGHVQNQKSELETQAAQLDIQGKSLSNELLDNIQRATSQERNLLEEIELRFAEKIEAREEFAYDRVVFELEDCERGLPERQTSQVETAAAGN